MGAVPSPNISGKIPTVHERNAPATNLRWNPSISRIQGGGQESMVSFLDNSIVGNNSLVLAFSEKVSTTFEYGRYISRLNCDQAGG